MNAVTTPVNRLPDAQAVEDLATILDISLPEEDQLAFIHWR